MAFDFHYMQNSLFQNICVGQTSSVDSRSINAFSIRTDKEMFQKRLTSIFLIDPCLFFLPVIDIQKSLGFIKGKSINYHQKVATFVDKNYKNIGCI